MISSALKALTGFLQEKQFTVAVAESCTGGLIATMLTNQPGSSLWFDRGFVTYTNQSKKDLLAVPTKLLDTYGAVSEPVAKAMVLGALTYSQADYAIAVTGIAGPSGGTLQKPVGTVYIAFAHRNHSFQVNQFLFQEASRLLIRNKTAEEALKGLLNFIKTS